MHVHTCDSLLVGARMRASGINLRECVHGGAFVHGTRSGEYLSASLNCSFIAATSFSTMSGNSEHSPDDTETETKVMEDLPNDSSKSEAKLMMNQTDAAMLEDEEMPTYISVSSTTKPDDSDVVNVKQSENKSQEMEEDRSPSPYPSDDQAASSVYVLSSEEETDQHPYNDEDDEDEYGDSDDMENLELDNEFDSDHPSNMKHLMDDEDDDDDDEDEDEEDDEDSPRQMHNDDDGIDDNYEIDCYDGRSDDFILNRRLKNRDKEKSLSLQDLNMYKNNVNVEHFKRRHSQGLRLNYQNIPEHAIMYSVMQRKQQSMPRKYHYVQSKVKRYIKDIKEQNRRSMEKHVKQHQKDTIYSKSNTDHKNNDIEKIKPTVTNKTIKDYAERTIKELEIAETCDSSMNKVAYNATTSPITLNGQDNKNCLELVHEESIRNEVQITVPFESTQNERDLVSTDNKIQKQNGTIEIKQLNYSDRETPHFGDALQPSLIQNGHQEAPTVLYNLRTLSYEEYMHGTSDSNQKTDLNKNEHVETIEEQIQPETYNSDLMDISTDNEDACPLRIENIKSIKTMSDETKNNNEQITCEKTNEEFSKTNFDISEVTTLKKKLTQKTVKYNSLLDTYQKQLMENLKMKQELDELRKTLAKYEKEKKAPEQKVASIQTDIDFVPNQHQDPTEPTHVKQSNNKVSGSSVASTLSSIDQWSSSAGNLSISMKPPEIAKTLHSDDSMLLTDGTPRKTRSLSRAFITSSRILQTLSNITQGKTKPESPLIQNSKKRLNESGVTMDVQNDDSSYQCQPSSSKKRKIVDTGPSNFAQSFKAFQTIPESHSNEMPNVKSQFKNVCDIYDSISKNTDLQASSSNANTSQLGATSTIENKMETADDPEDNVKCFVYREDENSKDRSFLILAEESEKDKAVNEKGRIRECGPYLLGNVEVRMSEINGTINIWGKEISQESTAETENETETSTKMKDKNYHCWQKTPHIRFNGSNLVCSTSKKAKSTPKFELSSATSNFSCLHSPSFNIAKASCSTDKAHADKQYSSNACISSCEDCDLSKHRKEWLRYKRIHPQEKLHSCCIHNIDISEQKCNCSLHKEKQKIEDSFNSKEKLSTQEHRRSFSRNLEPNKHLHENLASEDNEHICRNCTACRHSLHNPDNHQESHKCNMSRETCEPSTMNTDQEYNESCNHSSLNVHEEEPLITLKQCSETPETRRRRSTGKRVRGILMDLIRGCGDCYNPNVSNNSKSCMHQKESYLRSSPQIKISPCASPEPLCSNPGQPVGRCCHAYAQRIESQLEEFRMEMERVRSRSDAILNMLNMLHSVDTN